MPVVTKKEFSQEAMGEYSDTAVISQLSIITKAVGQIQELVDDYNYINENKFGGGGGMMSRFMDY